MRAGTNRPLDLATYLLLLVGAVSMLTPLFWMVLASFKSLPEILAFPPTLLPKHLNLKNYAAVFENADFVRYFINSVIAAAISVASVLSTLR